MSDPRPEEFRRFHELLTEHAPEGYRPWYFRCREGSKAPATSYGSWKDSDARLSLEEAIAWMEDGGNVGVAGTGNDELVNVDIDDEDETTADDLKQTLIARSRSRTGVHAWYFAAPGEEIPNIPTDDAGEVRANWQYVVAPGSYVETDPEAVPEDQQEDAGYYTVERPDPVQSLRFDELPAVFVDHHESAAQDETDADLGEELPDTGDSNDDRDGSALFDIGASDVLRKEGGSTDEDDRFGSVFHGSDTDANTSLSSRGLIQCWRHNVTHNGFQALVTLSDYSHGCEKIGTPHKGSNAGSSCLSKDDGEAVWHAWKYAKENGYIPEDDPVPYSALKHLCRVRDLCPVSEIPDSPDDGSIPAHAYDAALETIDEDEELDPGRVPTSEIDDGSGIPNKRNVKRVDSEEVDTTEEDSGGINSFTSLAQHGGEYGYFETNNDGETWFERVTNFELDVESFLFKDGERLIDMTVIPASGEQTYDLTVPAKVFNDARRFRDNVVTGLTTTFEGSPTDLNELRKLVGGQDAPVRNGTHHMGLHPDKGEFVTPDGVLTADGWTDDPEMAYIEREIAAERAFKLSPESYDDYNRDEVAEILELLPKTRNSDRFLPVLGWLYTAPLRPYIQQWEGQFNTLHVTGETGAGKSSTLSVAWQLLGMNGDPMACDDTKFALTTAMSSTNSVPMWFDEYKPGDMKDWELDRFQTLMRKSTRGGVETRGNADKSTEEYRLAAPLMISGEQAVQGAAEERRSIQTRFLDNVKETGSSTREAFAKLTGTAYDAGGVTREPDGYDLQQHAYAYYQFITEQNEEQVREQWKRSREYVRDLLTTHGITGVDDLPRQGIQTIHFGISMYARFATGVGADELPTRDEIDEALLYVARQFGDKGTRKSHLDRFVELASRAAAEEYIEEGKHYTVVKQGTPEEEIAIKLSRTFDAVSKYARDYALDGEDMLNTATDYRDRIKEASDKSRSYVNAASQYTTGLNRCVRIDAATAAEKLNFEPEAFGAETNIDEPADTDGDGEDPDGSSPPTQPDPTSIAEIDPTKQDRATVVGEIHFEKYDGRNSEDGRPDWTASVTDETGTARLIAWDEDQIPPLYNAQGVIDADEIKVTAASTSEYDDELQLTIEGGTTVEEYEEIGLIWSSADAEEATATDGGEEEDDDTDEEADAPVGGTGETAEYEGVTGKVREHLRLNVEKGEKFTAPSVAGELSGSESPGDVTDALIKLKTEGLLERKEGGLFELL